MAPLTLADPSSSAEPCLLLANEVHRLPSRLLALCRAIRLGSLDSQDLTEITRLHYQGPNGFEAEAHNLSGLWPWESEVVGRYLEGRPRHLVAGAGGGREAIALALYAESPIGEGAHLAHAVGIADPRIAIHGEWVPGASEREPSTAPAAHVFGGPA